MVIVIEDSGKAYCYPVTVHCMGKAAVNTSNTFYYFLLAPCYRGPNVHVCKHCVYKIVPLQWLFLIVSLENVFVVFYPSHYTVINWGKIPFRVTKNP